MPSRPERPARTLLTGALALLVAGLLAGLLAGLSAAPAAAHARFVGSDPAEGSTVVGLPASVVMTYSEEISPQFVDTAVVAPGGAPVTTPASVAGTEVTIDLSGVAGDVEAGTWQVVARVVSADGHPVEHTVALQVQADAAVAEPVGAIAGSTDPTADPTEDQVVEPTTGPAAEQTVEPIGGDLLADTGLPRWVAVLLAVAVAAAGAVAVLLKLRNRPPGD